MTLLRDISLLWAMVHVLILFAFLYESRYSKRKTRILVFSVMTPVVILNLIGIAIHGVTFMGQALLLTCTIPSLILYFVMAKNRNSKFLFTFCVVDTVSYAVICASRLIDALLFGDTFIVMFIIRILAFPLMEWLALKYLRKPFLEMKNRIQSGWGLFTLVTVIYYVLLVYMCSFPTTIVERPQDMPAFILVLLLMPLVYLSIYVTLRNQMRLLDAQGREELLEVQTTALQHRIEESTRLEREIKIQRHDIRHRYSVLAEMLAKGQTEESLAYISETVENFEQAKEMEYCENTIINAVFSHYVKLANEQGIKTDIQISVPREVDLNVTELSVVIANAFENATNNCLTLPLEQRFIRCKAICDPQFMLRISNPFNGKVVFDENGLPTTDKEGHGTGVRSIVAFCEKYDVDYEFNINDNLFHFSMMR